MSDIFRRIFLWITPRKVLIVFTVLTVLELIVLGVRVSSIWVQRETIGTTGLEGAVIYPIWKVIHGYPLYEWPYRFPFTSTPYNFLFFETYGQLFRVLPIDGSDLLLYGKLVTLALALVSATIQYKLCRELAPSLDNVYARGSFALSALLTWFGTGFTSWWALTIRPDVGATMFALWGLLVAIRSLDRNKPNLMVTASVLLFCGWAFKQTTVAYATGLGFYLIYLRRWEDIARLTLPFTILCLITYVVGGEIYFYNTIKFDLDLGTIPFPQVMNLIVTGLRPNIFFWPIGILGLLFFRKFLTGPASLSATTTIAASGLLRHQMLIVFALIAGMVLAVVAFMFPGSSRNHLFQAHAIAGILSSLVIAAICTSAPTVIISSMRSVIASLLILAGVLPALQVIFPNRYGLQYRFAPDVFEARHQFAEFLRKAPKPVYVDDDIFSLPWFATDNRYPAFPLDSLYYDKAAHLGLIEDGGMADLIARRCFAIVLLPRADEWVGVAVNTGYQQERLNPLWAKAMMTEKPWVQLTRTGAADSSCPIRSISNSER
jgi:hypothetical protein